MPQRTVDTLTEEECFALIRGKVIARLAFADDDGPAVLPVNFGIAGKDIVFRIEAGSHLRDVLHGRVAVEIDETDVDAGTGWSVLIRGKGREIPPNDVPALLKQMGENFPHPWAEGVHNIWAAVTPERVTGRHLSFPYFAANF